MARGRKQADDDDEDVELHDEEENEDDFVVDDSAESRPSSSRRKKAPTKRKSQRARDSDNDDEEEEERPAASQKKSRGKKNAEDGEDEGPKGANTRKFEALPVHEQRGLVGEVVRLLLFRQRDRAKVTSKEVLGAVLGENYKGMKLSKELLIRAGDVLQDVFGLELVMEGNAYFLRSKIALEDPYAFFDWPDPSPVLGLASVIIGMLHTNKTDRIEEMELFQALGVLGLHAEKEHPVFGKWQDVIVKKITTEQKYLIRKKEKNAQGDVTFYYSLGPRAKVETDIRKAESFVSSIYGRPLNEDRLREKMVERGLLPAEGEEAAPSSASQRSGRKTKSRTSASSQQPKKRGRKSRSQFVAEDDDEDDDDDNQPDDDEDDE